MSLTWSLPSPDSLTARQPDYQTARQLDCRLDSRLVSDLDGLAFDLDGLPLRRRPPPISHQRRNSWSLSPNPFARSWTRPEPTHSLLLHPEASNLTSWEQIHFSPPS